MIPAFLLFESILMIAFTAIDLTGNPDLNTTSSMLKYAGIILCVLFAAVRFIRSLTDHFRGKDIVPASEDTPVSGRSFSGEKANEPSERSFSIDLILLLAALCFTVLADYFLLLRFTYLPGILAFIPVQLLYMTRLRCLEHRAFGRSLLIPSVIIRLLFVAGAWIYLWKNGLLDLMNGAALFYFTNLFVNVAEALFLFWKMSRLPKEDRRIPVSKAGLFFAGLLLFLGCDLSVGLWNLPPEAGVLPAGMIRIVGIAMWTFYLPSQVLITLSGEQRKNKITECMI